MTNNQSTCFYLQEGQSRVRTIDLASKRRDQEEERNRRNSEKETEDEKAKVERPSIFGSAKPVDTTAREREIEERLKKDTKSNKPEERYVTPYLYFEIINLSTLINQSIS